MKRRDFIRLGGFLTISAATAGLSGCSSDDSDTPFSLDQRPMPPLATGSNWQFPQSIASGDPRSDSILLWTRVVPAGLTATQSGSTSVAIRLVVATDDLSSQLSTNNDISSATLVANVLVPSYADFDNTVRHKLTGLQPGKVYYYQFIAGDVRSNVGRFKTAPAVSDSNDVNFIFMSCQDWSSNHWGAFQQIVADDTTPADPDVDFIVHLGDYIYETTIYSSNDTESLHTAPALPVGADLPGGGKYAISVNDYRYLYKLYRSDPRIQAVHERFPMVAVWDDHEFSDDSWQASETYSNANMNQPARRRFANQAWFEFMPADVAFDEADTSFQNIRIYRDLRFGSVMHLVMTDERLYKSDHLIAETTLTEAGSQLGRINSRYLAPEPGLKLIESQKAAAGGDNPLQLISILGTTQREWWKNTMSASTAVWKVWGNEVSLLRMGLHGTNALATLLALSSVSTLNTSITDTADAVTGGNNQLAAAIVGAVTFGADSGTAGAAATAIAGAGSDPDKVSAAVGAGLTLQQATVAVAAYNAGAAGTLAAAQTISFGFIKPDIQANKADSTFFQQALGPFASLVEPFFNKFLLNADQWDGYRRERTNLMNFLLANDIGNVVAVTGDIHAFFAGQVYNEYPGETLTVNSAGDELTASPAAPASPVSTPAMVDLVVAGISSTSWFNYIKEAADSIDPLNFIIGKLVYVPVGVPASGPLPAFTLSLNLLDYTMGRALSADGPTAAAALAAQLTDQLKRKLGTLGVPEVDVDATAAAYVSSIAASAATPGSDFANAVALAQQLSALGQQTNPWLAHVDTEAQGYAVVTAATGSLTCRFRKLNPLVGTNAPSGDRIVRSEVTATVMAGTAAVVIS